MRVLMFTQYFTPEVGATQTRLHTFAQGLAKCGHDVEVICEVPNHPQGIVRSGFGRRLVDRRHLDGFHVRYVWVHATPTKTTLTRLAFYASYMTMAAAVGSVMRRPDVVFASSPPLPVAAAAAVVAARHRVPWVMDVRDLWPEAAVAVGELSNRRILVAAERLERWLYRRAAAITTVTRPFSDSVAAKIADSKKIHLLPNGTTALYVEAADLEPDRAALGLPTDKFIWTYAGNVGVAQGLEAAVEAAGMLGDEFQLLILGDGPTRRKLEERARKLISGSVVFRDQVAQEEAVRYLRASDALLVPLAADPVFEKYVPSKLYDFCAVGRPVIVAAAGEAEHLITKHGAGIAVPPGDPDRLERAVHQLRPNFALRKELSQAGHAFGRSQMRERGVKQLAALLKDIADKHSSSKMRARVQQRAEPTIQKCEPYLCDHAATSSSISSGTPGGSR